MTKCCIKIVQDAGLGAIQEKIIDETLVTVDARVPGNVVDANQNFQESADWQVLVHPFDWLLPVPTHLALPLLRGLGG